MDAIADTRSSIVTLEGVTLSLASRAGTVDILRGIDLELAPGRSTAIVGQSGSGKTSLLMVMAGLERPTAGTVAIAGQELTTLDEDQLALVRGRDIGIVFQSFHLVPTMTALENVALPLDLGGRSAESTQVAASMLGEVGLGHRLDHYPAQMSGGEQQRVAIARALAPAPKLLLADEPTGNLDAGTGGQIISLLLGLQERHHSTLVLVTHDETLAQRCDRIVRMADGRIVEPEQNSHAAAAGMAAP